MSSAELAADYTVALGEYVESGRAATLERATQLGERALELRLDAHDVVLIHFELLNASPAAIASMVDEPSRERRQRFLTEALRPFALTRHRFEWATEKADRLNANLLERTAQLEAANSALEAFNYSVSHDLRTSLQAVLGFAQVIGVRLDGDLSPEIEHYLAQIRRSVLDMEDLIEGLLGLAQVNKAALEHKSVDLGELAQEALGETDLHREGREVEISIGRLPVVEGDPVLLKRVLVNLLSNAYKFTRGRDDARIEIGSTEQDGECIVFVRDNGVGFDMKRSEKLFAAFERLHGRDQFEGTGVGLALAKQVVARHGGRIWAEGKPGEGATFYFALNGVASGESEQTCSG